MKRKTKNRVASLRVQFAPPVVFLVTTSCAARPGVEPPVVAPSANRNLLSNGNRYSGAPEMFQYARAEIRPKQARKKCP
jgi:hypothetical protein